jgi:hypothetical protein
VDPDLTPVSENRGFAGLLRCCGEVMFFWGFLLSTITIVSMYSF